MKKSFVLLALFSANAFAQSSTHLVLHGLSSHSHPHPAIQWNERNWGVGVRHQFSPDWGVQAGAFRNSYRKTSVYALAQYTPLHIGPVSAGGFFGPATQYPNHKVVGGALGIYQAEHVSIAVRITPRIGESPSVKTIEAGIRF